MDGLPEKLIQGAVHRVDIVSRNVEVCYQAQTIRGVASGLDSSRFQKTVQCAELLLVKSGQHHVGLNRFDAHATELTKPLSEAAGVRVIFSEAIDMML